MSNKYKIHVECRPGSPPDELEKRIKEAAKVSANSGSGSEGYANWQFYYPTEQRRSAAVRRLRAIICHHFEITVKEE